MGYDINNYNNYIISCKFYLNVVILRDSFKTITNSFICTVVCDFYYLYDIIVYFWVRRSLKITLIK